MISAALAQCAVLDYACFTPGSALLVPMHTFRYVYVVLFEWKSTLRFRSFLVYVTAVSTTATIIVAYCTQTADVAPLVPNNC